VSVVAAQDLVAKFRSRAAGNQRHASGPNHAPFLAKEETVVLYSTAARQCGVPRALTPIFGYDKVARS